MMKYRKHYTIPKSNMKIVDRGKTHKYMIGDFISLAQALQ